MVSTPRNNHYRHGKDPYIDTEVPDFLRSSEKVEKDRKSKTSNNPKNDSDILRNGEQNQNYTYRDLGNGYFEKKSNSYHTYRDLGNGYFEEEEESDSYRNNVNGGKHKKAKKRGLLKKLGPLGAITSLIFGGGFFFLAAQSFLAPHLSALYTQATDLQFTHFNLRNARLMSYMLDGGSQVDIGKLSLFTGTKKYNTFTPWLQKRLIKNGIEVGHINADGDFEAGQAILGYKTALKYDGKIIDADSFQDEFAGNASFRDAYYSARRSRVAGFFDESADEYYKRIGATRDIFSNYKSTGNEDDDIELFKSTVSNRITSSDGTINTVRTEKDEETGEEINEKNGDDVVINDIDGATPESKARAMVNSIAGKVSTVGVPVCSALRVVNLASVAVLAYQTYQSIAYFLSFMEPISKMMAGEGDTSGINEALNLMTKQDTSTVQYVDENGVPTTIDLYGSMLESSGAKAILGKTLSPDSEIQPFSVDNIRKAATRIAVGTGATNTVCSGVMAASAIVSLVANSVPGGGLATFVVGSIMRVVGGIVMTGVVSIILNAIIPYVAKIFGNVFEAYVGKEAGNAFTKGAFIANSSLAKRGSAFMPASEERVKTQNHQTSVAIAQEAEIDRLHRSPLDATSPNTFLGSIMSKFSYLSYSNSLFSNMTGMARIASNAAKTLIPTAAAIDDDFKYTSLYSNCSDLDGIVCEMYDYPIVAFDYSTIDISPYDSTYQAVIKPNLDENGQIKDNSELAKFIKFCVDRESPWGVLDVNILNAQHADGGIILNNFEYSDNILDAANAIKDVLNTDWAKGYTCYNSSDNPRWDSEFKYYQLYVSDMRSIQSVQDPNSTEIGSINPVLAFQERYNETHPVDNSFEGTLSRVSGLSKNDVAFLLEYINYSNELAKYDPSTRDTFGDYIKPEVKLSFAKTTTPNYYVLSIFTESLFIDRRNYII